jgi:hypothetical protein
MKKFDPPLNLVLFVPKHDLRGYSGWFLPRALCSGEFWRSTMLNNSPSPAVYANLSVAHTEGKQSKRILEERCDLSVVTGR